jgi:hypothetical protein
LFDKSWGNGSIFLFHLLMLPSQTNTCCPCEASKVLLKRSTEVGCFHPTAIFRTNTKPLVYPSISEDNHLGD